MTPKTSKPVVSAALPVNPHGRLDIALFRMVNEHVLPVIEQRSGIAGLADQLRPVAESFIGDLIPPVDVLKTLRPRRRLC